MNPLQTLNFVNRLVHSSEEIFDVLDEFVGYHENWRKDLITVEQCTDGITNKLLKLTNDNGERILFRIYGEGTDKIINRENELITMITLSELQMIPKVIGRFANGICYGFVPGTALGSNDLRDSKISCLIAKTLRHFHSISVPLEIEKDLVFSSIKKWLTLVPSQYKTELQQLTYKNHSELFSNMGMEFESLRSFIIQNNSSPVLFCHNDLLAANLILPDYNRIIFIDFEYASYNYRDFDIANHFNEFAGFDCDYSLYPSVGFQIEWLRCYFSDQSLSLEELESIQKNIDRFRLVSHFYWGVWALVQASISDLDFDYIHYASLRFKEYYLIKDLIKH